MDLTISIVNWNVKDYLKKCLLSIKRHAGGLRYEIIVVDNASSDDSVTMVRRDFPDVKLIENNENVGYGSAHNQAMKIAQGEYILFLNPDTEMLQETLPRSIEFMKKYPKTVAILCREIGDAELDNQTIVFLTKFRRFLLGACQWVHRFFPNPVTKKYIVDCIAAARLNAISGYVFGGRKLISENGFIFSRQEYLEGGDFWCGRMLCARPEVLTPDFS
jgi:GT2 family glycosyltransferase